MSKFISEKNFMIPITPGLGTGIIKPVYKIRIKTHTLSLANQQQVQVCTGVE